MDLVEEEVMERNTVKASAVTLWLDIKGDIGLPNVSTRLPPTRELATVYENLRLFYLDRGFCKKTDFPANPVFSNRPRSRNIDDIEPASAGRAQDSVIPALASNSNPQTSKATAVDLPGLMAAQEPAVPESIGHRNVQIPQEQENSPAVFALNENNNVDVLREKDNAVTIPKGTQGPAEPLCTGDSRTGPSQGKETTSLTPAIVQEPARPSLILKLNVPFQPSTIGNKRKQHSPEDGGHRTKSARSSQISQRQAIDSDDQGPSVNTKKVRSEMLLGPMLEKILSTEAEPITPKAKPLNVRHAGPWLHILDKTASIYHEKHSKVLEEATDSFEIVKDGLKNPPKGLQMGDWDRLLYLYSDSKYRSVSERIEVNLADAWVFDFVNVEAAMRAKKEGIPIEEAGRKAWEEFFKQRDSPPGREETTKARLDESQEFYKVLTTLRHLECEFLLAYRVDQIPLYLKSFGGGKWDNVCSLWSSPLDQAQWRAYAGPEPLSEISDVPTASLLLNGLPQGRNQSPFINAEISDNLKEIKLFCVRKVERGDFLGIIPGLITFKASPRNFAIKGPAPGLALECGEAHGMLSALMQRLRQKRGSVRGNVAVCWQQYRYEDPETKEETVGWRVICVASKHIEPLEPLCYAGS
ncbi:MAG: hypothetical protein Q9167_007847 [Letrouitia subvulpina]